MSEILGEEEARATIEVKRVSDGITVRSFRLGMSPNYHLKGRLDSESWIWTRQIEGLDPGHEYHVNYRNDFGFYFDSPTVFFTLPLYLPDAWVVEAEQTTPFTVALGSCFSNRNEWQYPDPGAKDVVSKRYKEVFNDPRYRPALKFLVGDQVYIDQPLSKFGNHRMSTIELTEQIHSVYNDSWDRLGGLLKLGGNICTTDDHEFWNDYPIQPNATFWPSLTSAPFRRTMEREALKYVDAYQRVQPTYSFEIGSPAQLSFFVADTRMFREPKSGKFMRDQDFNQLLSWVNALESPGILVVGQPLFSTAVSRRVMDIIIADHNLPYFHEQYLKLVDKLLHSPHDILVLTGDIHYGRIATASVKGDASADVPEHKIVEVTASPLSLLDKISEGHHSKDSPVLFPHIEKVVGTVGGTGSSASLVPLPELTAPISYDKLVPTNPHRKSQCVDHFMTLSFARNEPSQGGLRVTVRAWTITEGMAWEHVFNLDEGKFIPSGLPASMSIHAANSTARMNTSYVSQPPCMPQILPATAPLSFPVLFS